MNWKKFLIISVKKIKIYCGKDNFEALQLKIFKQSLIINKIKNFKLEIYYEYFKIIILDVINILKYHSNVFKF